MPRSRSELSSGAARPVVGGKGPYGGSRASHGGKAPPSHPGVQRPVHGGKRVHMYGGNVAARKEVLGKYARKKRGCDHVEPDPESHEQISCSSLGGTVGTGLAFKAGIMQSTLPAKAALSEVYVKAVDSLTEKAMFIRCSRPYKNESIRVDVEDVQAAIKVAYLEPGKLRNAELKTDLLALMKQ